MRFVSRSQNRRRRKRKNGLSIGARKARERVPTPIHPRASRDTKPPSRVETSKRRFQTSRRNAFPQHCDSIVKSRAFFPLFFRRENPRARARSLSSSGQRDRRSLSLARSSNEDENQRRRTTTMQTKTVLLTSASSSRNSSSMSVVWSSPLGERREKRVYYLGF